MAVPLSPLDIGPCFALLHYYSACEWSLVLGCTRI